jgi:hypothetical protein
MCQRDRWFAVHRVTREAAPSTPAAILAAQIQRQRVTTAELPEGAPRDRLIELISAGRAVHLYRHGGGVLTVEITPERPWHDPRWAPVAWCAYVRGEHSQDIEALCQCGPCIEARQEAARARYAFEHGEEA